MPRFKLIAGSFSTGEGPDVKYYSVADPKATIVESDEDLAALDPAKFEVYEGPAPKKGEEEEAEEPPPPPAGDAERAAALAFQQESQGVTPGKEKKAAPRTAPGRPPEAPKRSER